MTKRERVHHFDELTELEDFNTEEAFGHEIPDNIELEPFLHPPVSLRNARMLRKIRRKMRFKD